MGGGLMQLVAYGAQDIYLTGNPQITFFKVVYRRHTNFAREAIQQTLDGTVGFGNRVSATISRNGDLVTRMYLQTDITIDGSESIGANPGHTMVRNVEVEIGGQMIDRHTGLWMETYADLTQKNETRQVFTVTAVRSDGTLFQNMACAGGVNGANVSTETMYVPLQFWFCRNPGLALPLIALQYHEVKVILEIVNKTDMFNGSGANTINNFQLWADYIYLDTDERRRFAQVSHEYLIEQVQEQSFPASTVRCDLTFNHPVKELIWVHSGTTATLIGETSTHATPATFSGTLGTDTALLKLNGHERFAPRPMTYFTRTQIYEHHTGFGSINHNDGIAVYSFALQPEEHQPSGTCNFSRIDNAILEFSATPNVTNPLLVYAVNYNVLRIMSGMGGLAYSN